MTTELNGVEFDPGFAPYTLAFGGTVEYLYADINRFRNLSQKKMKFKQYYKKLLDILDNNLGFYVGCLMWASYIKTLPEQEILNNSYYGEEYDEENNISEVKFIKKFVELFPRDMKYYMNQNYEFDPYVKDILDTYEEFLVINKGFVEAKNNTDILVPDNINTSDAAEFKKQIMEYIDKADIAGLLNYKGIICHSKEL